MLELAELIPLKEDSFKLVNVSDLLFHYTTSDVMQNKKFLYYLEK